MQKKNRPVIDIAGLHKWFGDHHVLKGIDLQVMPSDVVVVIGASGSGKSTLLRCVNLLEDFQDGEIRVGGVAVHKEEQFINTLRSRVGMVFQHFHLFPHMTTLGNVMEGPRQVRRMNKKEARELAGHYLEKVGMADKADAYPQLFPAGRNNAWPSRERWPWNPKSCFLMNRHRLWIRNWWVKYSLSCARWPKTA